ncbi:MAG TPA: DMT family transporter [Bacteroidales bacterium]|nr:DMT family transporter [Bacteroidales bacterium]
MNSKLRAHIALLAANIIYGVNFIAVQQIIPTHMSWQSLALLRGFGALALLLAAALFIKHESIDKKDWWRLIIAGLLGVTINQSLLVWGLELTSSVNAAIIMTSNPLFVMIFSALLLKFPITPIKALGVLVGASGALLLILTSHNTFSFTHSLGDIIIVSNAILYALYLVWIKPLMTKYSSFTVMKFTFLFGAFPVLLYGLKPTLEVSFSEIPLYVYGAILFVVVGATFLTYFFKIIGLQHVNPTTVSIYIYIQPIIASIIAIYMGNDSFSIYKILAMILVFAGVYIVTISNKEKLKN